MPNTQLIRRRIKSITNTSQITKAMEMVAASKMKRAQDAVLRSREFAGMAKMILALLKKTSQQNNEEKTLHPLLKAYPAIQQELIIVITSDKGLCGSYNVALLKKVFEKIKTSSDQEFDFITLGKKGRDFLSKQKKNIIADFALPNYPSSKDLAPIVTLARESFTTGKYQKVSVAYTDFVSTLKQEPKIEQIFPISQQVLEKIQAEEEKPQAHLSYKFEPSQKEILDAVLPRLTEVQIYQAILESLASEHSSRMLAMKNATDNAKDIIKELTLTYNSVRQASITQELAEISGGVEAIN